MGMKWKKETMTREDVLITALMAIILLVVSVVGAIYQTNTPATERYGCTDSGVSRPDGLHLYHCKRGPDMWDGQFRYK